MNSTLENQSLKLLKLDPFLRSKICGQDHVIPRIVSVLLRGEIGLTKDTRPRGSFLFLGPTGVGKTRTALAFSNYLFGRAKLFRFDMSEFQNQESLGLLLGRNAGERGSFGSLLDRASVGTILLDEIEKAHASVLDILLQILDAARITLASGETLNLSGFYVVMTSNLGSAELTKFQRSTIATIERSVLARAQQFLRPELYARITEKLVFNRLDYDIQIEIARLLLRKEIGFFLERGYRLEVDAAVLPFLVRHGFHPRLGVRPMRDAVEKYLGDAVTGNVVNGGNGCGLLRVNADSLILVPE